MEEPNPSPPDPNPPPSGAAGQGLPEASGAWSAVFFDGRSSKRRTVELRLANSLLIVEAGATLEAWDYASVRAVDAPAGMLRLCSVTAHSLARLELRDPGAQRAVARLCRDLTGPGGVGPVSAVRIAAWSLAAAAAIAGMIRFGVPAIADQLAEVLPPTWERPLGQAIDKQVRAIFPGEVCSGAAGREALTRLVGSLQGAANLPVAPDPVVLRSAVPNAFALPGGRIYVLSGLLERAGSADELAGVLAHEFGHVAHRDGVRVLIRDGGTGFLIGLLFGDISGAGAALFAARSLLSAAYARDVETAADTFAIGVMHRLGRPTAPLGALLLRIAGPEDATFSILHDHPLTPERARRLERADRAPSAPALLSAPEWRALRTICD